MLKAGCSQVCAGLCCGPGSSSEVDSLCAFCTSSHAWQFVCNCLTAADPALMFCCCAAVAVVVLYPTLTHHLHTPTPTHQASSATR